VQKFRRDRGTEKLLTSTSRDKEERGEIEGGNGHDAAEPDYFAKDDGFGGDSSEFGGMNELNFDDEVEIVAGSQSCDRNPKRSRTERGGRGSGALGPRKPHYTSKVMSGPQWNAYTRAHYSAEDPPPRVVKGYRFTVHYPDLMDPTVAPTWKVEPLPSELQVPPEKSGGDKFCMLRFIAGAPYEDIAFRIVDKKWEKNPKKGFVSVFERGVFHLKFNFERSWWRR